MDQNYRANILVMCNVWNEPIILCKFVEGSYEKSVIYWK